MTTSLACSTAYLQSAVFALAALWGSDETLAVMSGQGGIAVLVSFAQVILAVLGAMRRSAPQSGTNASVQSTLAGVGLWAISAVGAAGCIYAHTVLKAHVEYPNVLAPVIARGAESARAGGMGAPGGDVKQGVTGRVFRKNKELEMAVAWVFVVTLSVFPPITTAIVSTHSPPPRFLQPSVFIPLHFLLFNVGDFVGRTYLPAIPSLLITNPRRVLALSLARTLFVPLFLACNVAVSPATTGSKPLLNSDAAYFLILIAFGLTNGPSAPLDTSVATVLCSLPVVTIF
ncbi:hypothetical protein EHS25_000661 [Saitozyma podzolica]|uniref:Uncharacterized protein n=1 Tax=Saitozyma podzolica TaxID=1890683 RepID=A0A427YWV4_9TREE|nr:hypothetical protein EHS25_000661 [Saitozyma podzolica]